MRGTVTRNRIAISAAFSQPDPDSIIRGAHIHMQALPGNCRILEAFDIKPAIMVRTIPDMLIMRPGSITVARTRTVF